MGYSGQQLLDVVLKLGTEWQLEHGARVCPVSLQLLYQALHLLLRALGSHFDQPGRDADPRQKLHLLPDIDGTRIIRLPLTIVGEHNGDTRADPSLPDAFPDVFFDFPSYKLAI